ncbi:MAG: hypothetical protein P1Q69_10405 [Candidatus Thorarchaeota archaeon]|nr:hypothetical protein [Candidatus Thorarchaeota archaeon]
MSLKNPVEQMLKLAHTTIANHYQYYHNAALNVETPDVKALLMVLADTEAELMDKIKSMMVRGIITELEEIVEAPDWNETPDEMPFDLTREDTDPRIFVCNKALKNEIKGYTFFLSIAARAKSKVISRLFEYLAYVKLQQIHRIRKVCESF